MDGIVYGILFESPLWSLARGDVFITKPVKKILMKLRLLPVYRITEGSSNLPANYETFRECVSLFENDALVLIFSEGITINEWRLRSLRKGTARLALQSWKAGIDLKVLPVGINYDSFSRFGKTIHVNLGEPISRKTIDENQSEGNQILSFNEALRSQMQDLVYEIGERDDHRKRAIFGEQPVFPRLLLALPALIGFVLHAPFYYFLKALLSIKFRGSDHFDAVFTSLLVIFYPAYIFIFILAAFWMTGSTLSLILIFLLPFFVYCLCRFNHPTPLVK